ncbi:MAG: GAF domain-containing protein [Cyanophyceae cyanobacterium]
MTQAYPHQNNEPHQKESESNAPQIRPPEKSALSGSQLDEAAYLLETQQSSVSSASQPLEKQPAPRFQQQLRPPSTQTEAGVKEDLHQRRTPKHLHSKATATALIVGMLPALAIGTATYYFGNRAINEQVTEARRAGAVELAEAQQQQLLLLLIGTGATALLAGVLAALWANRTIQVAKTTFEQTPEEIEKSRRLAHYVQLEQQAATERQWTQYFVAAAQRIHASFQQEEILATSVAEVRQVLGCDRVVVYGLEEGSRELVIAESVAPGYPRALGVTINDPCFEARYSEKYQNGLVTTIDNIYEAKLTPCYIEQLEMLAVKANLVAPILQQGQLLGLLIAHQCSGPRHWQEFEIRWFAQMAMQMGFAIDNARLLSQFSRLQQQTETERQWTQYFVEAAQRIHTSLNEKDVLAAAVEEARRVLGCDRVVVYGLEGDSREDITAESVAPGFPRALGMSFQDPCFEARYIDKYQNGRVKALDNIYEAELTPCYIEQLESLTVKASLVAPIVNEGQLLGLLIAHQCSGPRHWQEFEIRWFAQMAMQVGFALAQAKLLEQSRRANEQQQRSITLLQRVSPLLKESETAVAALSTEALRQSEAITALLAQADPAHLRATAHQLERHTEQTDEGLSQGQQTTSRCGETMAHLHQAVAEAVSKVRHLSHSTAENQEALSLIHRLAEQLHNESMNVAIQTGRSGQVDQAAVMAIAETVRSLTQQLVDISTQAQPLALDVAREIKAAEDLMETGASQALAGTELIAKLQQQLNRVATVSEQISILVKDIHQTATEQTQTAVDVRPTVQELASLAAQSAQQAKALAESRYQLMTAAQIQSDGLGTKS